MRKLLKFLMSRFFLVSVLILFQLFILFALISFLNEQYAPVAGAFWFLRIILILVIINKQSNPIVKIPWILLISLAPVFGGMFFIIFGSTQLKKKDREKLFLINGRIRDLYPKEDVLINKLTVQDNLAASQSAYIKNITSIPLYENCFVKYFSSGESFFPDLLDSLKKAEKYIFLEYFIIEPGLMWNSILEILEQKVKEGVLVRCIYDDIGSVNTLPKNYCETLKTKNISCIAFNPYRPTLKTILNNRDHRKLCVIDGHTAFTGGVNIADEYINKKIRFGYWKDSVIKIQGKAAFAFSLIFLELWSLYNDENEDFSRFQTKEEITFPADGFIQPYSDSPLDNEHTGELVYINVINQATRYVYITTPYFIVDNELLTAIQLAAKRNVDVRIITPHIPDKKLIHEVTRSYYRDLVEAGVRVFEFEAGFMHSKSVVADDKITINGTINFDFRSLYHHFECGIWMYKTSAVLETKNDFLETQKKCREITPQFTFTPPLKQKIIRYLIKIFAPLL